MRIGSLFSGIGEIGTDVSNPESNGFNRGLCSHGINRERIMGKYEQIRCEEGSKTSGCDTAVSHSNHERLEGKYKKEYKRGESKETSGWRGYWSTEPNVGRVVNGLSNRVDRIKCLGNSVVPQVAQIFAQAIKKCINDGQLNSTNPGTQ